jgi:hypothetical protein
VAQVGTFMAVIENEHVSLDSSSLAASALVLGRREVFIDAVNSRQLHQLRMPILRALLPEYVAKCELNWSVRSCCAPDHGDAFARRRQAGRTSLTCTHLDRPAVMHTSRLTRHRPSRLQGTARVGTTFLVQMYLREQTHKAAAKTNAGLTWRLSVLREHVIRGTAPRQRVIATDKRGSPSARSSTLPPDCRPFPVGENLPPADDWRAHVVPLRFAPDRVRLAGRTVEAATATCAYSLIGRRTTHPVAARASMECSARGRS